MRWRNTPGGYGLAARIFHWLVFAILLVEIAVGWYMSDLATDPDVPFAETTKGFLLFIHESMALIVLVLILLRLGWKFYDTKPLPVVMPPWKRRSASFMHGLLYVLILVQPISGLIMVQANGYPIPFFGLFTLPPILPVNEVLGDFMHEVHEYIWQLLGIAVLIHAGAALHHHFIVKDNSLKRMLTGAAS